VTRVIYPTTNAHLPGYIIDEGRFLKYHLYQLMTAHVCVKHCSVEVPEGTNNTHTWQVYQQTPNTRYVVLAMELGHCKIYLLSRWYIRNWVFHV